MLSQSDLDAIRSRAEAATDGGWSFTFKEDVITDDNDGDVVFALDMYRKEDAQFIAHARTDVPRLVEEVERLRKLSDELYGTLRMAEDVGVDESLFEEDERGTGPDGYYAELEARWQELNTPKDPTP